MGRIREISRVDTVPCDFPDSPCHRYHPAHYLCHFGRIVGYLVLTFTNTGPIETRITRSGLYGHYTVLSRT